MSSIIKVILLIALVAAILFAAWRIIGRTQETAELIAWASPVKRLQGSTQSVEPVSVGATRTMYQGDGVNVEQQGRAQLNIAGCSLDILQSSGLQWGLSEDPGAPVCTASMNHGTITASVTTTMQLETEWCVIRTLGTRFLAHVDGERGLLWIIVQQGRVEVATDSDRVVLEAGQQTWARSDGYIAPVRPANRHEVGELFPPLELLTNNVVRERDWLAPSTYQVALIVAALGDRSFLDSAARGIDLAHERLPNVRAEIIEAGGPAEQRDVARAVAEEGFDLVITVGFDTADWVSEMANEYPDTHFAVADAALDVPNGTGLAFREHEGAFTVGMVAAMLTETRLVGFVGGMDTPLVRRFEQGFIQGVQYANPEVEVISGWTGSFNDPPNALEVALSLYYEGADILYTAAGGSDEGVINAAIEMGLFAIANDTDQCDTAPGNVICSMMKMIDVSVFDTIQSLTEGTLEAGTRVYGLEQDAVGMCYLYDIDSEFLDSGPAEMAARMQQEVIPAVRAAVDRIKAGEMCVLDDMEVYPCDNPAEPGGMGM